MVAPLTAFVCITHHLAIACICVKYFVMSLPALSLGDGFSVSRKGGQGGIYTQRVKIAWLGLGLSLKIPQ